MRLRVALYLLALLSIGTGVLAILPPYEGIDEAFHYSSIRQIGDLGTIPLYQESFLPQDVPDYKGPMPYGSSLPPLFEGITYARFFADAGLVEAYRRTYRESWTPPPFQPSLGSNLESQHPPLYYLLLAPLLRGVTGASLTAQFFVVRLASFLFALGGVFFGILAAKHYPSADVRRTALLGWYAYPLLFPMFFPEFARIGNDSLCLLFTGCTAYLLARCLKDDAERGWFVTLGVVLGLGLLTKGLFLPVTLAVFCTLFLQWYTGLGRPQARSGQLARIFLTVVPALAIGAGWYAYKFVAFGTLTGSFESAVLAERGGLIANLGSRFSLDVFLHGLGGCVLAWIWGGSFSLTRPAPVFYLPVLALVAWTLAALANRMRRSPLDSFVWTSALAFTLLGGGLLYHIFVSIALNGYGGTPGWYLHILMPWLAPLLGVGLGSILGDRRARPVAIGLLAYAFVFQVAIAWSQFALFSGCAVRSAKGHYAFPAGAFCLDRFAELVARMEVLGWPWPAALAFAGGLLCGLCLLLMDRARVPARI